MSDYDARKQLQYEIDAYIKKHPGCCQTDIVERLYPKFETAFSRSSLPESNFRKFVQSHVNKLIKHGDVIVGEHPTDTVKSRPMRIFTWRYKDGKDQSADDAD